MKQYKVFVDGQSGTTGLRLQQRLRQRDDIALLTIPEDLRKDLNSRISYIEQADISFLCLPDAASKEIAACVSPSARILDTSTAHRTDPQWVYGFPEMGAAQREKIRTANRLAVPGCHASGFQAIVYPLIRLGIVERNYPFCAHSITGYSGGGKKMIAAYQEENRPEEYLSPRQYALGLTHKHLPEMQAINNLPHPPIFNPIVADFYSGMVVTVPLYTALLQEKNPSQIAAKLQQFYADSPLITVHAFNDGPSDGYLAANTLSGKDTMEIFVMGNETQIILAARFDNLGKGASGAALQCMNLMLGLEEQKGLVI